MYIMLSTQQLHLQPPERGRTVQMRTVAAIPPKMAMSGILQEMDTHVPTQNHPSVLLIEWINASLFCSGVYGSRYLSEDPGGACTIHRAGCLDKASLLWLFLLSFCGACPALPLPESHSQINWLHKTLAQAQLLEKCRARPIPRSVLYEQVP